MSDLDTPEDAFADARQVQRIAETLWVEDHPGESFPPFGDKRCVAYYDRAKAASDGQDHYG